MKNYRYQLIYINYEGKCITKYFITLEGAFNHIKKNLIFSYDLTDMKTLKEVNLCPIY